MTQHEFNACLLDILENMCAEIAKVTLRDNPLHPLEETRKNIKAMKNYLPVDLLGED